MAINCVYIKRKYNDGSPAVRQAIMPPYVIYVAFTDWLRYSGGTWSTT